MSYSNDGVHDAAYDFLRKMGIDNPTPDAIDQLSGPFAIALRLMCERGYDPEGSTWKTKGWKGLVHDILNKAGRIKYHSWRNNRFDGDSAIDIINFAGFYYRLANSGTKWGELGEPGLSCDTLAFTTIQPSAMAMVTSFQKFTFSARPNSGIPRRH